MTTVTTPNDRTAPVAGATVTIEKMHYPADRDPWGVRHTVTFSPAAEYELTLAAQERILDDYGSVAYCGPAKVKVVTSRTGEVAHLEYAYEPDAASRRLRDLARHLGKRVRVTWGSGEAITGEFVGATGGHCLGATLRIRNRESIEAYGLAHSEGSDLAHNYSAAGVTRFEVMGQNRRYRDIVTEEPLGVIRSPW